MTAASAEPAWQALLAGFAASLSLIVAIGAQNAFVLRQGLLGQHVFAVCLLCAVLDALLISAGVGGFHVVLAQWPQVVNWARWAGAAFLLWYGWRNAVSAWRGTSALQAAQPEQAAVPLGRVLLACAALTLLNPHVYLDTVVLLGMISARFATPLWFAAGAITASVVFFFSLGYGARLLRPVLSTPRAWRVLDVLIAATMWALAVALLCMPLPEVPGTPHNLSSLSDSSNPASSFTGAGLRLAGME